MTAADRQLIEDYWSGQPDQEYVRTLCLTRISVGGQNTKLQASSAGKSWFVKFCRSNLGRIPEVDPLRWTKNPEV